MKRISKAIIVASFLIGGSIPAPVSAQTVAQLTARVDSLRSEVAALKVVFGDMDIRAQADLDRGRPAELPNGDYPVFYHMHQLAAGTNALARQIDGGLENFGARLRALETAGPSASSSWPGNTVSGDLIVTGKLCVTVTGACFPDAGAQVQIINNGAANIMAVANYNGSWWQNPAKKFGMWSLSGDGGMRILQNNYARTACVTRYDAGHAYQDCSGPIPDPTVATGAVGFDSQGEWSWNGQKPGAVGTGTQRIVLRTDEAAKQVYLALWAEGWTFGVRASGMGCKWCENLRWNAPVP